MKETWALASLLCYVAILHGRMTGKLRGVGLASASVAAFSVVLLTYFGVNMLFSKGLHTYGFADGTWTPFVVFFGVEGALIGSAILANAGRRKIQPAA